MTEILLLYESLGYKYRIKFSSDVMSNNVRNKSEKCRGYKLHLWVKIKEFYILNDISEHVILV